MNESMKHIRPMAIVFVIITALLLVLKKWLLEKGVDRDVLVVGNMVLFLVSLISFLITYKSLSNQNTHAFVRSVYTGFISKFFIIAIVAFIYIVSVDKINKPALFVCMGLYIIYAYLEVSTLLRILKKKKNA